MSTEFLVLTGACTIFALFTIFATIVNWIRHKDSQYSTVSVSAGSSATYNNNDQVLTPTPAPANLELNQAITPLEDAPPTEEIESQPYKRTPTPVEVDDLSDTEELEILEDDASVVPSSEEYDVSTASIDVSELAQDDLDAAAFRPTEEISEFETEEDGDDSENSIEEQESEVEVSPEESSERTPTPDQTTIHDNTVPFMRVNPEPRVEKPVEPQPVEKKPTLLKFSLVSKTGNNTLTGSRLQMIASKHSFKLQNGVFKRSVCAGCQAVLSIFPAVRPFKFESTKLSGFRSHMVFLGMTLEATPQCLQEFKTLLRVATQIETDFGCKLCDENGIPMSREKLNSYVEILRASFTTASETSEMQASAMM